MYISILIKLILGYVRIQIEGYYIEKFINICTEKKILIWNLKREKGVKLYLNVGIRDYKKLRDVCRKTKCKVKIQRKRGVPFILNRYKKRKIFIILLILILISIYVSSKYVWNIEIQVEENYTLENIKNDLNELGLKRGIAKKDIDTDRIINEIRIKRDDISWMGIDIRGTNVIVKVVKADEKPQLFDENEYCNIIASKSGIITKVIAQNGTPIVKVGDTVQKGDVLIAGYMEGKYTEPRYVHSMGEVQAKVWYTESEKIFYNQQIEKYTGEEEKKFQIKLNKIQINFYKTLSKFEIYDTIYTEKNIRIFSNFYLPISVIEIINKEQVKEQKSYNKEEAIELGKEQLSEKIENKIENKENILRNNYKRKGTQ